MELEIFDVEHGACALLTCDDSRRIMIDCGHNATTGWRPGTHLRRNGIVRLEMLTITNFDEDHVSGLPDLLDNIDVRALYRNESVTPAILRTLKSEDGMGAGIDRLVDMMPVYTVYPNVQAPAFPGVQYDAFYLHYPQFDDENNLSLALRLTINGIVFLFTGDLENAGWKALLEGNPSFREAVRQTNVLVASHHGRIDGYEPEVFTKYGCNPFWVVISDKGYVYESQETVNLYGQHAIGGSFRGEDRKVLTTRNDGNISFIFEGGKWWGR